MRGDHLLLLAALLCPATASAQVTTNLLNGDFEAQWPGGASPPPDWNWKYEAPGARVMQLDPVFQSAGPGLVYNGAQSCRIHFTAPPQAPEWHEFGKAWDLAGTGTQHVGKIIRGVFRIRLSDPAVAQYVSFAAFNRNDLSTRVLVPPVATTDWQEVTVSHEISQSDEYVRIGLYVTAMSPADHFLLDFVVFGGSDPLFNAGQWPDHEIRSSALSLLVHGATGGLKHLRDLPATPGGGLGDNMLTSDPNEESKLYSVEGVNLFTGAFWKAKNGSSNPPTDIVSNAGSLQISATDPAQLITLLITIGATSSDPEISFEVALSYSPGASETLAVEKVLCPSLRLQYPLGPQIPLRPTAADDRYFVAGGAGSVTYPDQIPPAEDLFLFRSYPGDASMQFLAYYDDDTGFGMMAKDSDGHAKALVIRHDISSGGIPEAEIQRRFPRVAGSPIQNYPVVLFPCRSTWMRAASHYRGWALQQPWATSQPLPRPAWVNTRPIAIEAQLQPTLLNEGSGGLPLVPLDSSTVDWTMVCDAWSAKLGGSPITPVFRAFEQFGVFAAGPNQTPLRVLSTIWDPLINTYTELYLNSESELQAEWTQLVASGHIPMAMVTALKWTKRRDQDPMTSPMCSSIRKEGWTHAFDESNSGWTTNDPNADEVCIRTDPLNTASATVFAPGAVWDSEHGRMCPWHTYTKNQHAGFASYLATRGVRLFELDQMIGGSSGGPCYHPQHGHPPGFGRWMYLHMRDLMILCHVAGTQVSEDFALSLESPGELFVPYLAAYIGRTGRIHGYPAAGGPFSQLVPAFNFVYGHLIDCQAVGNRTSVEGQAWNPGSPGETPARDQHAAETARAFVSGSWMAARLWSFQLINAAGFDCTQQDDPSGLLVPYPSKADVRHLKLLEGAVKMGLGGANAYFEAGTMTLHEGQTIGTFTFTDIAGESVTIPEASLSSWQLGGWNAIVVANARYAAPVTVTLPDRLDDTVIPPGQMARVTYHTGAPGDPVPYSSIRTLTVPENEVVLIELLP